MFEYFLYLVYPLSTQRNAENFHKIHDKSIVHDPKRKETELFVSIIIYQIEPLKPREFNFKSPRRKEKELNDK